MKKEMTPEEIQKMKEAKRVYNREYMARRRQNDPDFAEKQRELVRQRAKERYYNDEEYRKRNIEAVKKVYNKYREAYKMMVKVPVE
jgi:hypothetical protein